MNEKTGIKPDCEGELIDFGIAKYYHGEPIEEPEYFCRFFSAEKGTFFGGFVSTEGEFDVKKLKTYFE